MNEDLIAILKRLASIESQIHEEMENDPESAEETQTPDGPTKKRLMTETLQILTDIDETLSFNL